MLWVLYVTWNREAYMNTKLTLRLDEALIRRAKAYSEDTGKSLSRIVADYFDLLTAEPEPGQLATTPIVDALRGSLKGTDASQADYRRHLEEKYL